MSGFKSVLTLASRRPVITSVSLRSKTYKTMEQVEVDEAKVQQNLGKINMAMIKKAEQINKERAERHIKNRKKDFVIGGTCAAIALSIYFYTMFAIKQETFLDDFEVPNPLPEEDTKK